MAASNLASNARSPAVLVWPLALRLPRLSLSLSPLLCLAIIGAAHGQLQLTPPQAVGAPQNGVDAALPPLLPDPQAPAFAPPPATTPPSATPPATTPPTPLPPSTLPPSTVGPATITPPSLSATSEAIGARLEQLKSTTDIESSLKDALLPLYQRAQVDIKSAADAQRLKKDLAARLAAVPKALADGKQKKDQQPPRVDDVAILDFLSFDELQSELQSEQAKLTSVTETRTKLAEQIDTREKRRKELPQLISEVRAKVEQSDREQTTLPAAATMSDPLLKEAARLVTECTKGIGRRATTTARARAKSLRG